MLCPSIRIFHGCEAVPRDAKQRFRETDFSIRTKQPWPRFFFLYTFWSPSFDFNIGVALNELRSYTLTSAILKVDVLCDVKMTSIPNVTWPIQPIYWQHVFLFVFIYPTGRIRVYKIKFVSTGANCGKPCLVCKKESLRQEVLIVKYIKCVKVTTKAISLSIMQTY